MAMMTRKRRRMMEEAASATAETATAPPSAVLPEELMIEILARVEVSNPLQLRCVCKWWKSLVVDPQFVKKHLHRSFTDITDLASKAMDDMNAFESQLIYNYAPAAPPPPLGEEEDDEEDAEDEDDDDDDDEEEEETRAFMNEVAQLDNLLLAVRSLKGGLETIKVDVQAIKERMKCLQSFLLIYLKTAKASLV